MAAIQTETRSIVERVQFHWVPSESATSPTLQRWGSGGFTGDPVKLVDCRPSRAGARVPVVEQVLLLGSGEAGAGGVLRRAQPGEGVAAVSAIGRVVRPAAKAALTSCAASPRASSGSHSGSDRGPAQ